MNVVILSNEWPPVGGGVGTSCRSMVECTAPLRDEYEVDLTVVAPGPGTVLQQSMIAHRAELLRLPCGKTRDVSSRRRSIGRWVRQARALRLSADLWHVWDAMPGVFLTGKPFIVTVHGCDVPGRDPGRDRLFRWVGGLYRRAIRRAFAITGVTPKLCSLASAFSGRPVQHVPHGVPSTEIVPRVQCCRPIRLLAVSRLDRLKNVHRLVQLASSMKGEAVLRIVGDGPERGFYRDCAVDNIEWLGWREDVSPHYRWCDVFVNVTYATGAPMTVLEAKAHGRPSVAVVFPGCADVSGLYPSADDAFSLRRAILWVASHYDDAVFNATKDRDSLLWSSRGRAYFELYRKVLHG